MTYICCEILFVNLASCQIKDKGQPKHKHTGGVQYLWSSKLQKHPYKKCTINKTS